MKILAIVNKGKGRSSRDNVGVLLRQKFGQCLVDVEYTKTPQQAMFLAGSAISNGVDTIVAVGGDGTLNPIVNSIAGTDVALGLIPRGTANDLASLYRIPADVSRACEIILGRRVIRIDLIRANGVYFVTSGGVGLSCEIVRIANAVRWGRGFGRLVGNVLGENLYVAAATYGIAARAEYRLTLRSNDFSSATNSMALMISNQRFTGKKFLFCPAAKNDDGMFDVCLIEAVKNPVEFTRLITRLLCGKHLHLPYVRIWQCQELDVEVERPLPFLGDGEVMAPCQRFDIKISPRTLNVIIPNW